MKKNPKDRDSKAELSLTTTSVLKDIRKIAEDLGRPPTKSEYFANGGAYNEWQLRNLVGGMAGAYEKMGIKLDKDPEITVKLSKLTRENKDLKSQLKEMSEQAVSAHSLKELIGGLSDSEIVGDPSWLTISKKTSTCSTVPVLFLSDLHLDEVVDGSQMYAYNAYDREIATERLKFTFEYAVELLKKKLVGNKYDGAVVVLGGDILSGNIHEELTESNDARINQSIIYWADKLASGVEMMANEFGRVFVPCVTGNHGRMHKKPRAKNRAFDNFEWLIYQMMAKHFRGDKRVSFLIPDGPDAHFSIYNTKFLLTHGDSFSGGNGVSGIFTAVKLGVLRKRQQCQQIGKPFDIALVGHFHQYIHGNEFIVNGSMKGYDEYAHSKAFPPERPQQALFLVHKQYGVTIRMPVLCDAYATRSDVGSLVKFGE